MPETLAQMIERIDIELAPNDWRVDVDDVQTILRTEYDGSSSYDDIVSAIQDCVC